jgi:enoyl-CoA hydratase
LTGEQIGAGDAIAANLADFYVESAKLGALGHALSSPAAGPSTGAVSAAIERFVAPAPASTLPPHRPLIDRTFAFDEVGAIVTAIDAEKDEFAVRVRQTLLSKSPTSLKVTLRLLRLGGESADLKTCLEREFAATAAVSKTRDFYEGARAAVIDKDRNPRWSPRDLASVDEGIIAAFFAPCERPLFS